MQRADCVVIGAGIAGLSLAARLAERCRVVVLEAEAQPGYHASGRSVAFAHFGLGETIVRTLTTASIPEFSAMQGPSGAPIASVHPALHIAREDQLDTFEALAEVHERFGCAFTRLEGEEIATIMPVLKIGPEYAHSAILDTGSLKLDTDAMLQRHAADLRARGGELVTGARVLGLASQGNLWVVETGKGVFETARIVNAAGAWADEIARLAGVNPIGLEPRRRTVISYDGPEGVDVSDWPFVKTVGEGFYTLPEGRSRLLASYMDQTPSAPCDAAAEELDIAIAADRIVNATTLDIRRIAHSWAGLRSFAPDELPVVGEAEEAAGFYWMAGQGGYGFQTSAALSQVGACAVFGEEWLTEWLDAGVTPEALSPRRFATRT